MDIYAITFKDWLVSIINMVVLITHTILFLILIKGYKMTLGYVSWTYSVCMVIGGLYLVSYWIYFNNCTNKECSFMNVVLSAATVGVLPWLLCLHASHSISLIFLFLFTYTCNVTGKSFPTIPQYLCKYIYAYYFWIILNFQCYYNYRRC